MLLIGLGNPEKEYATTRHNAGFIMVDELQKLWSFPKFTFSKKFNAEISEGNVKCQMLNVKCLLMKPATFMNRSGESIRKIIDFYKLKPKDIIVIQDDLDIEIGNYKISHNISSAGHKGIESIINQIGTTDFKRIRIGVEKEGGRESRGSIPGDKFVLENFTEEELKKIKKLAKRIQTEITS